MFWLRGLAWDLYGLATIKRQLVLSAFEQSDIQLAHDRSTDVLSFLDACNERNAAIKDVDDNDYWMSWKQLDIVTWFNMQRIRLSLGMSGRVSLDCLQYFSVRTSCQTTTEVTGITI